MVAWENRNMPNSHRPAAPETFNDMHNPNWSPAQKAAARKAFERALGSELMSVIQEVKERAARIEQPSDLWNLEHYLTRKRKEIDRTYDYRYSVLPLVFAHLLSNGRLTEEDLRDLGPDKLRSIRAVARIL